MKLPFTKSLRTSRPRTLLLVLSCATLSISASLPCTALANQSSQRKSPSPPPQKIDPRFQETQSLLQQGRFDEARQQIQTELTRDPKSVEGYKILDIVCVSQKDFPCSLDAFQHALTLAPSSTRTKVNLGNLYIAQQKLDLAEKEFKEVLTAAPSNSEANYNLGLIFLSRNQPAAAIPLFERVSPATTESQFNLGVILAAAKQYKSAQSEFEKANALKPEDFDILFNLAQTYLRSADFSNAELVAK